MIEIERKETFKLSLTREEIISLFLICGAVGGSPENTFRRHTDKIYNSISKLDFIKNIDYEIYYSGGLGALKDV